MQRGSTFHKVVFAMCVTFMMTVIMYELKLMRHRYAPIHIASK